jgi:uncharacterized membrane protein YoaK (UPF0700 family)
MTAPPDRRARSRWLPFVLSFGAGATDAFAFLALGGIFTANMTGNLVLVGLVGRDDYLGTLIGASVAIAVFFVVLLGGFRFAYTSSARPQRSTGVLLGVAAFMQVAILLAWWVTRDHADQILVSALVAFSAAAMALQTVVARTSVAEGGVSTTFVTGTIVSVVDDLAQGRTEHLGIRLGAIGALVAGSFAGALSILAVPSVGPLVSTVTGCIAVGLALLDA